MHQYFRVFPAVSRRQKLIISPMNSQEIQLSSHKFSQWVQKPGQEHSALESKCFAGGFSHAVALGLELARAVPALNLTEMLNQYQPRQPALQACAIMDTLVQLWALRSISQRHLSSHNLW